MSVSNLDKTTAGLNIVGSTSGGYKRVWGQAFTTGLNTGGHTLASVSIRTGPKTGSPSNIMVALHAASGSNPGTQLATLSGKNQPADGTYVYTCSWNRM